MTASSIQNPSRPPETGLPPMMRAIRQETLGGPEVLELVDVPRPEAGLSEILVRVHAAGVNPTDWKHRRFAAFLGEPPLVLGWDVSGVVEAVGRGVTLFKPGVEVFGMLPYPHGVGSHAEFVKGPARAFVPKPANLDHVQAAAIPLAALTAWQALVDTARVSEGDRVLIHAAAGGVGHMAVQIAKDRGAYVIGTSTSPNHDFLHALGADELIDYRDVDFAEVIHDVDVALDTIGGDYQLRSLRTLRPGGVMVSTVPFPKRGLAEEAGRLGVRTELILVEADQAGMLAVAALAESGQLRPTIAGAFPMAQAAQAHELGETNRTVGKLVLIMDDSAGS